MPFFDTIRLGASASGTATTYSVDRSLRFNDDDSPVLTRTPSSTGTEETWTYSCWVKRSNLDTYQGLLAVGTGDGSEDFFGFHSDNKLYFRYSSSSDLKTNALYRDISAWLHIVVIADTTQSQSSSTASDSRLRLYVNGEQITSFEQSDMPSQGHTFRINTTGQHYIGEYPRINSHLDGYLAEVNFVDGNAYDPSYFGETNATTGQWNPKKYTGSYGTNGFYLNFSDNSATTATTLGKDESGNSNNFTPNNFSVSAGNGNDSSVDTPTNNFPTWNPLYTSTQTGGTTAYSEGNLKLNTTTGGGSGNLYPFGFTSFGARSGKWYAEFVSDTSNHAVGIANNGQLDSDVTNNPYGAAANTSFIYTNSGEIRTNDGNLSNQASYGSGDIIGVAMDLDNMKLYFHKNGTYINSGNPSTGSNGYDIGAMPTGKSGEYIFSCGSNGATSVGVFANLGQIKTASTSYADAGGIGSFNYTVPTGFKALCSANLPDPTILLPNKHFEILLYTGNATYPRTITGLQFQPDWFWSKTRNQAYGHPTFDSVRGTGSAKGLRVDTGLEEGSSDVAPFIDLTSFNFTSGTDGGYTFAQPSNPVDVGNGNGLNFVAWNWNAGDADSKTYKVKVVSDSTDYGHGTGSNKYQFFKSDGTTGFGTNGVDLDLEEGGTYIFDWSDSSAQSHPIRFSLTNDGTHSSGTSAGSEYTTGVTKDDSAYKTTITIASGVANLFYYCQSHSGMGAEINTNTTKGSTNFDGAIQSTVKVNASAGFSIVKYSGSGNVSDTVGHGLNVNPAFIAIKQRTGTYWWRVYHSYYGTNATQGLFLNETNASYTHDNYGGIKAITSTTFGFGTNGTNDLDGVNKSSNDYIAYCFSEVSSYSKFGSYVGNGNSNGTFVFTGFRPAWVMTKNVSSTYNWMMFDVKRSPFNDINDYLFADLADAEGTGSSTINVDFLSNGFKWRGSSSGNNYINKSGDTFVYFAFAESPFRNARAR